MDNVLLSVGSALYEYVKSMRPDLTYEEVAYLLMNNFVVDTINEYKKTNNPNHRFICEDDGVISVSLVLRDNYIYAILDFEQKYNKNVCLN